MQIGLILKFIIITLCSTCFASELSINFDLEQGEVKIEIPYIHRNGVSISNQRRWFRRSNPINHASLNDSYLFISGDPGYMSILFFHPVCLGNRIQRFHTSNYTVIDGELFAPNSTNLMFLSGNNVVRSSVCRENVVNNMLRAASEHDQGQYQCDGNDICSDRFKDYWRDLRIPNFSFNQNDRYLISRDENEISISWDPQSWSEREGPQTWEILRELQELFE